ncbi:aminoacyl-tRNA hydrolase [Pontimonas sp.]|nr:aminoacyl-tRNA hydrolase [Pontimonas sp.]MDB4607145.1 aminoacyl-tRNA hydrolase [Pontimonas sp.]MDC0991446.1 aminoacyl-tRNA hydrolase [Pontimonas sp.]
MGLGNPGSRYDLTRHNVGERAVVACAASAGETFSKMKSHGMVAIANHPEGIRLHLATTTSFMNVSGAPVRAMLAFYKIPAEQLIVVHDELDLEPGVVRLKKGGGHAGHNGIRDVAQALGTPEFLRIRVGIGRPEGRIPPADYVLQKHTPEQEQTMAQTFSTVGSAIELLATEGLTAAQGRIHSPSADA